jgi:glycosyltransferase involved in cell wall biosynthesis
VSLVVELERELPASLPVGTATAVFCIGTCFDTEEPVTALSVVVDGTQHPVLAAAMPRPDRLATGDHPAAELRSGFWAIVPAHATAPGPIRLGLEARLANGEVARAELGVIDVVAEHRASTEAPGPGTIAVCMATFEPDRRLLQTQISSLREQDDPDWICLISDDCSTPESFAEIEAVLGGDPRFTLSRTERRQGFYRNFERALRMVPPSVPLIALCDQDDHWHPDKLSILRGQLGDAILVYSDQRLVDAEGRLLRETLWQGRSNNYKSLTSALVANTITGAATLFRRELLELALPFPDTPGFQFHDTWIAVMALAAGRVGYVDRPLYDYVQHPGAVFGDVTHGVRGDRSSTARSLRARLRNAVTASRAAYFYGYLPRAAQAQVALVRGGDRLEPAKRRELERFLAAESSLVALLRLALRPARALLGHTETLGSELGLVRGLLWRRVAATAARQRLVPPRLAEAGIPPPQSYSQKRLRAWRARV